MTIIVWGVALGWQVQFDRATAKAMLAEGNLINYHESRFTGKGTLFFFCENCLMLGSRKECWLTSSQTTSTTHVTKRLRTGS
jgi:hypothetical protein